MFDLLYRFIRFGVVILHDLQLSCGLFNFFVLFIFDYDTWTSVKILFR